MRYSDKKTEKKKERKKDIGGKYVRKKARERQN